MRPGICAAVVVSLAATSLSAAAGQEEPRPPLSPRNANYTIAARLEPETRTLTGQATIQWRNDSPIPAPDLRLHLYWNAWRDLESSWMRDRRLGGDTTLGRRPAEDRSSIEITDFRLVEDGGAVDLTGQGTFLAPDDGNTADRTLFGVPLPSPVGPGETVTLEVTWTARVPRTYARTGVWGDYYFIAQWFPKLGVLEADGWNAHQFHSATEFYADFGVYDVELTVPTGWVVGATGREQGRTDHDDATTTHRYRAEDVHDFAWTTSPDLIDVTGRFEAVPEHDLPAVDLRLLLQPEHAGQAERHFAAARATLRHYGEWFGAYPYDHLTVVDPAWQSGSGGMEYPTLFTAGTRWLAPTGVTTPEGVLVHEAGHQWWYGVVATNEFEYAWMDEGFNTFSTARTIDEAFNPNWISSRFFGGFVPWVFRDIAVSRATVGNRLYTYRRAATGDRPSTPTYQAFPGTIGRISYDKTALWLTTLERWLGWPTLQQILHTYRDRWQFRHPTPDDFFAIANEVSGRDLTPFFDEVYRSAAAFDYGVDTLFSTRVGDADDEEDTASGDAEADVDAVYRTEVVVRRYGDAVFPVDVLVTFTDGHEERTTWDGRDRWRRLTFERDARVRSAVVDPDRVLLLDVDYANNSRTLEPRGREAATKWSLRWLVWLQDLVLTWGFLV